MQVINYERASFRLFYSTLVLGAEPIFVVGAAKSSDGYKVPTAFVSRSRTGLLHRIDHATFVIVFQAREGFYWLGRARLLR